MFQSLFFFLASFEATRVMILMQSSLFAFCSIDLVSSRSRRSLLKAYLHVKEKEFRSAWIRSCEFMPQSVRYEPHNFIDAESLMEFSSQSRIVPLSSSSQIVKPIKNLDDALHTLERHDQ